MQGVVRQGDICSGHGCWPPRPPMSWSPNVFVNNKSVVRFSDLWVTHCCPGGGCHMGTSIGSNSVYANNLSIQKKSDPITCGSKCMMASSDVFIGH